MKFPIPLHIQRMSIRTRLLVLVLLFGSAVLVNMLALVSLARAVSASLVKIESAHEHQLIALKMYQELSNAEAALYRYQLENFTGFAGQFNFEINNFGGNVQAYRALASTPDEHSWASELNQVSQDSLDLGNNLIRVHDQQATDLKTMLAQQTQLTGLLSRPVASSLASRDTQHSVDEIQASAQTILLAVITHLTTPDQPSQDQFGQAAKRLQASVDHFRTLADAPAEVDELDRISQVTSQVQTLGAQLIDERDQQQILFVRFSAEIFEARQLVIFEQIQPLEEQRLSLAQQNLQTEITQAILISLSLPILLTLVAVLLAIRLTRTLDRGILTLLQGADHIAAGDLAQPVEITTGDELNKLAEAFNKMRLDLSGRERGLQARLAELEILRKVSLQITSSLDLDQVLNTIVSGALGLVEASSVQIYTRDENNGALHLAASAGQLAGLQTVSSLITSAADTGLMKAVHAETEDHAHSTVALPMQLGDQVLGVLYIASDSRHTLSSEDLRILRLLTDQATGALNNARLYRDLTEREEHVRALMEKMAHIQDAERRLIGLDLHDGLTQLIISANMHLNSLGPVLSAPVDAPAWQELEASRLLIKQAIEEARRVIDELRPTLIEDLGLAEGLRRYVLEASETNGWESETQIDLAGIELSEPAQAAIFRIAQEALSNARKHSGTRKVRVVLQPDQADLFLCVQDWGIGFNPDELPDEEDRLGLMSMDERTRMLGGTCEIVSKPGQGTSVIVRVPCATLPRSST